MADADHRDIYKLLEANQADEALARCQSLASDQGQSTDLSVLTALCHEAMGQSDRARHLLSAIVTEDPAAFEAHFHLGRLDLADGQLSQAKTAFEACTGVNPNHAGAWTWLGRVEAQQDHLTQAVSYLRTALKADPDYLPALIDLTGVQVQLGQLDEAQGLASQAVKLDPGNGSAQLAMAEVLIAQGYWGFAEQSLVNALKIDPENLRVHWAWANFLQKTGRHQYALVAMDQVQQRAETSPRLERARAISLRKSNRIGEAIDAWTRILASGAIDTEAVLELATLYGLQHRVSDLTALKNRLDEAGLEKWLDAQLASLEGDIDRAQMLATELCEEEDEQLRASAQLFLMDLLAQRPDQQQPLAELVEAWLGGRPQTDAQTLWKVAQRCRQASLHALGVRVLEHVMRHQKPDDTTLARTHCLIGNVLDETNKPQEATEHLLKGGWQTPYLGGHSEFEQDLETIKGCVDALMGPVITAETEVTPAEPKLIAVVGWPMTGRDLVLSALTFSPPVKALALGDWPSRKQTIAPLIDGQSGDDAGLTLMRRRYFKSARPFETGVAIVESAALSPIELASLIRLHPNIQWVMMTGDIDYVVSHWRLMGYRQVPSMMACWERDQAALEYLHSLWPGQAVTLDIETLLTEPGQALHALCQSMQLQQTDEMTQAIETHRHMRGYRSFEHIERYQGQLLPKSSDHDVKQ